MEHDKTETVFRPAPGDTPKIDAIITARGKSKGIPKKNIYPLNGNPLIYYTIKSALECDYIRRCIVTTDDQAIKDISLKLGAEVIDRPDELATDEALSSDVVRHALLKLKEEGALPDYFVLLQPTSPLRTAAHVSSCISQFLDAACNSCISVTPAEHSPYKMLMMECGVLEPIFDMDKLHQPRQCLPAVYRQNGAIYIAPCKLFMQKNTFFIKPVFPYVMSNQDSVDIDTLFDIKLAELLLNTKHS